MSIRRNPIAYLALFLALGGTSYAAIALPANSIGSRQLRNGAVTNAKIRQHSLTASSFKAGTLPKGSTTTILTQPIHTTIVPAPLAVGTCAPNACDIPAGTTVDSVADCPAGQDVVGGGYTGLPGDGSVVVIASLPSGPTSWTVASTFTQDETNFRVAQAYAVCAH